MHLQPESTHQYLYVWFSTLAHYVYEFEVYKTQLVTWRLLEERGFLYQLLQHQRQGMFRISVLLMTSGLPYHIANKRDINSVYSFSTCTSSNTLKIISINWFTEFPAAFSQLIKRDSLSPTKKEHNRISKHTLRLEENRLPFLVLLTCKSSSNVFKRFYTIG